MSGPVGIAGQRSGGPTGAVASIVTGVQAQGPWTGRRQLFVRFAAEAETATLFTPDMLVRYLERSVAQGGLHSIAICGRDPLICAPLLSAAFAQWRSPLPVMLDHDGQRPEAMEELAGAFSLVQVTVEFTESASFAEHVMQTLARVAAKGCKHALSLVPRDGTSDGQILRFVEQAHAVSAGTKIVVHPPLGSERGLLDRRFGMLLEQALKIHDDVRLLLRIPSPVGMR